MKALAPGDPVFEAVGMAIVERELEELERKAYEGGLSVDDVEWGRECVAWGRAWLERLCGCDR